MLRFSTQRNPKQGIPQENEGEMKKRLGEDVDLGLLLQSSKYQQVWVDGLGVIEDLVSS